MKIKCQILFVFFALLACEGPMGDIGPNGLTSLISSAIEPRGENCLMGGHKIETGIDLNGNNILDSNETTNSIFICNGQDDFLMYLALVNQLGSGAPQSSVIKNTLDLEISWVRTSQGKFKGTLNKEVDLSKTVILNNNIQVTSKFISESELILEHSCGVNAFCDEFSNLTLEIKLLN
jgi:hypothetical protein